MLIANALYLVGSKILSLGKELIMGKTTENQPMVKTLDQGQPPQIVLADLC